MFSSTLRLYRISNGQELREIFEKSEFAVGYGGLFVFFLFIPADRSMAGAN